jgi:outer membrane protein assembly factor BamB
MPRIITSLLLVVALTQLTRAADPNEELLAAAKKGDLGAVKTLLAKGADANAKNSYGATALSFAADKGHLEVVKLLLEHKADPNAKDTFYKATPLEWAVMRGHTDIAKALIDAEAEVNDDTLIAVSSQGNVEIVRAIIEKAKPKQETLTKALAATPAKHTAVAELLTKAGAKPAAKAEGTALAAFAGTYRGEGAAELKIVVEDGMLAVKADGGPATKLAATGKTSFKSDDDKLTVSFRRQGDWVSGLTLTRDKTETAYRRVEVAPLPSPAIAAVEDLGGVVKAPLNWPSFRGPNASGVADGQFPPLAWDAEKNLNIRWKTPIPGLGHSCPVVWGDRIYVTTAVPADGKADFRPGLYGDVDSANESAEQSWRVYCVDKRTGKVLWEQTACKGVPKVKRHIKGSHANPTPATDGAHVVASFGSEGLYCYDRDGKLLWSKNLGNLDAGWFFDGDYQWGFGSSPVLYKNLVIAQCDVGKDSFIAAFDVADGRQVWRKSRDEIPSWGTPTVVEGPDRVELVTNATKFARGYDPLTGEELWRLGKHAEITVPTPVFGAGLIFVTSGYRPVQPIYAIRPGAEGDITLKSGKATNDSIAWSTEKGGPYMPTPIVYREHLYVCSNDGVVTCYEAKTGKQVYKERLGGRGGYTASPVAADGKLYFTGEESGVRVVQAGPKFELLAVNPLGDPCMATPAISDGMIFLRTQHYLIAAGRKE